MVDCHVNVAVYFKKGGKTNARISQGHFGELQCELLGSCRYGIPTHYCRRKLDVITSTGGTFKVKR